MLGGSYTNMKVFITISDEGVVFLEAVLTDKESNIGDISEEIKPGESFFGTPYADFIKNGNGEMEIKGEVQ